MAEPGPRRQRVSEDSPTAVTTSSVLTIPNLLSLARLLLVPVYLWIILWPHYGGPKHDVLAFAILAFSGISDYLDGKLARRWNQVSRVGQLLDPAADRLYILATLVGLAIRALIPWWLVIALVVRDGLLFLVLPWLRRYGYGPLPVHYLGKAATFCLMYAFPLLLLTAFSGAPATLGRIFGWAFAVWGTALYWWAGVLYVVQARQLVAAARAETGQAR